MLGPVLPQHGLQAVIDVEHHRLMQVAAAILPEASSSSATRAYDDSLRSETVNTSSGITVAPETRWQKQWKDMQAKVRSPLP